MANLVHLKDSSLQVRDIKGNHNEVFYAKITCNFNDLSPEQKDILEKALTQVMQERLIDSQAPQSRSSLTTEGTEDAFVLHKPLKELEQELQENEGKEMIELFCRCCPGHPQPASVKELFTSMMQLGKLRLRDFTFLQCLLWSVGRQDLFQSVAEKAQELKERLQEDDPEFHISHLHAPHLKPINGYKYVKFHLHVDTMTIHSERLRKLEMELARILDVPRKFVAVVGVEPDGSAWVTVLLPEVACAALETHFQNGNIQNSLASLDIDKVGFFSKSSAVAAAVPLSCAQEMQSNSREELDKHRGTPVTVKEGRPVLNQVSVTFWLEGREAPEKPLPQNVTIPVGLLKQEMEEVWDIPEDEQVWLYEDQELADFSTLQQYVDETESHIDIKVKVRSPDEFSN